MSKPRRQAFTLVELLVAMTISGIVLAGVLSTVLFFTKSSMRLSAYNAMETQATRGIEVFGRDLRMAQKIVSVRASSSAPIHAVVLTIPPVGTGTSYDVTYTYDATKRTFSRVVGTQTTVLVRDIEAGSFKFVRYDLAYEAPYYRPNSDDSNSDGTAPGTLIQDHATNQLQVSMTASPETRGLFARATKRVISARFVLRNR